MRAVEAIDRASAVYSELGSDSRVCQWLSEIEERICTDLAHKKFTKITEPTSQLELCAPQRFAEVYPLYLIVKFDIASSDYTNYSFHNKVFNSAYELLKNHYGKVNELPEENNYNFL